ncbi:dTDP-4-dehydrorhamnose 3,5-epimerase [Micromonospora rosaria]|uniref:dTDP-4-dehydrorhamnose 3,5-epimerase n=1 Tax=Micromonospora rosaria TaxID=47874 RepID=A0A136PL33_9ACTN|nr:dTDP-4-dehydrorhamnose 3,5-epimerase family protein [Micromonospora rosaria]KXK59112.1 dTDP-4-dehydrorhamnose 3,5-epimerase [Micromonospora rosaria]
MRLEPLGIEGAWKVVPRQHADGRGLFAEWYRHDRFAEVVGHPLDLAQANVSVSRRGVVRGIHFSDVPPGQAKYITCVSGEVVDVVVDLRVGSPTFGRWEAVPLDDVERAALYLAEGLGHGFCTLSPEATVVYLCSSTYDPERERAVHPFDPELGIRWPTTAPRLSDRDATAPGLAELRARRLLPDLRRPGGD